MAELDPVKDFLMQILKYLYVSFLKNIIRTRIKTKIRNVFWFLKILF